MTPFIYALIANIFIASVLVFIVFVLSFFQNTIQKYLKYFVALTVGVLMYLIFLDFIPEISEQLSAHDLGAYLFGGLALFYVFEMFLHWHHCTDLDQKSCSHSHGVDHSKNHLMSFGTLLHNVFHGIVLFTAFSISVPTGITLTVAILLHALPQNIANFFMNSKEKKGVFLAALGGVAGVLLLFPFQHLIIDNQYIILAFTAGGLLYLALTDIFPSIHGNSSFKEKLSYLAFIILGFFILSVFNAGHDHESEEDSHAYENLDYNENI